MTFSGTSLLYKDWGGDGISLWLPRIHYRNRILSLGFRCLSSVQNLGDEPCRMLKFIRRFGIVAIFRVNGNCNFRCGSSPKYQVLQGTAPSKRPKETVKVETVPVVVL
jgi:hypothetical protein